MNEWGGIKAMALPCRQKPWQKVCLMSYWANPYPEHPPLPSGEIGHLQPIYLCRSCIPSVSAGLSSGRYQYARLFVCLQSSSYMSSLPADSSQLTASRSADTGGVSWQVGTTRSEAVHKLLLLLLDTFGGVFTPFELIWNTLVIMAGFWLVVEVQ